MSKKDWKKVGKNKWEGIFFKISITKYVTEEKWTVLISNKSVFGGAIEMRRYIKYERAIKFAKDYMRKN